MSWQIPTLIEQDIKNGKAQYRTFQTGNGGQSILPVPSNSYVVIFGYDFSPAGGGLSIISTISDLNNLEPTVIRWFETQQISFYTGTDFYPFIHHINAQKSTYYQSVFNAVYDSYSIDNSPIARQVYITSTNDVTVTHGLILNATRNTTGAIPVTNRTPLGLTYGGSGQVIQAQTDYGPAVTPVQFLQPSPKDFNDFGLGLIPANADNQAFATPDATNGLREANDFINSLDPAFVRAAASNYYLCLHYALYTETVPEYRG